MRRSSDRLSEFLTNAWRRQGPIVVALGVHDPTSAVTAASTGYEVLGTRAPWVVHVSGFGVAAARFLLPDNGQIGWDAYYLEIKNIAHNLLKDYPDVILTIDMDHGYGDAKEAAQHAGQIMELGIAGLNIEDQQYPWAPGEDIYEMLVELQGAEAAAYFAEQKNNPDFNWYKSCGHIGSEHVLIPGRLGGGKIVLPLADMVEKVEKIAKTRDDLEPQFGHIAINARTDIFSTYSMDAGEQAVADAVERGNAYLQAGADSIYYEAVPPFKDTDEIATMQRLVRETDGPCTFNALRGGRTKTRFTIRELEDVGAARVHLPTMSYQAYACAMMAMFRQVWQTKDDSQIPSLDFAATGRLVGWPTFLGGLIDAPEMLHEIVKQGGVEEVESLIARFTDSE